MKNKRMGHLKSGLLVVIALTAATVSFGQGANFSGSWAINESKSNLGDGQFRMFSPTLAITQDANAISVERTFKGQDGEDRKMTDKYTLDGKESENPVFNDIKKKSVVTWSDDKSAMTVTSTMVFDMNGESNTIKTVEVYKLSDGDKILTIDSQSTSSRGERKMTLVYDKK